MIKKLSMMVLGVAVMGFCMAAVPEGKAEGAGATAAAQITVNGSHNSATSKHYGKSGVAEARCEGNNGSNNSLTFSTNSNNGKYSTTIKQLTNKAKYKVIASASNCYQGCKASKSKPNVPAGPNVSTSVNY